MSNNNIPNKTKDKSQSQQVSHQLKYEERKENLD